MSAPAVQFGPFRLNPADRRLSCGGDTVDLNARYMDVLLLLVEARGELVTKDQFMERVWHGVPVTDEALTQAVRTLRKALDDSASTPRFIETVPKHGYRFIAPIDPVDSVRQAPMRAPSVPERAVASTFVAGTLGAMMAGAVVGLLYGFLGAMQPAAVGGGALSLLLVLVVVSTLAAAVGGAGISAGIAASALLRPARWYWTVAGGALGGLLIGGFANLIGRDGFRLLFGRAIGPFAGALEGVIMGAVIGLAAHVWRDRRRFGWLMPALFGLCGGIGVALLDGRMMAGSLHELVTAFPSSRYRLDGLGRTFGENGFGPITRVLTAAFEGAVFSVGIVWALKRAAARTG